MKTITFYSYKGGNGRTLAAANFAVYLAKLGLNVAILDFDLDAPGVDSKFPNFALPKGQLGLIDYVLRFQREGCPPGPIREYYCTIKVTSPSHECTLGLIPAGDYLSGDYPAKLNELDWLKIFSDERGVAFFQLFLDQIKNELKPDVLIIDSRTGFSEIGGLCTQQLADETVFLSSMASESVKMTRHLAKVIRESPISRQLNKLVETKIVVCRVPKPSQIEKLKEKCCREFDVDETKLFFLFSCPGLEREEFVAMLETQKDDALVSGYIQLFRGLDVEIAEASINEEIEKTDRVLLSYSAEQVEAKGEARVREMVALFPHPEVYRRAMRFFSLNRRPDEASLFALRLLDFLPGDKEAQLQLARFVLRKDTPLSRSHVGKAPKLLEVADTRRLISVAEQAYANGQLSLREAIRLADILEDSEKHAQSFQIAFDCLKTGKIEDPDQRLTAMGIAARTALKLGKKEEAIQLVAEIPLNRLGGSLANLAIQMRLEKGNKSEAFEFAKGMLSRNLDPHIMETALELARELSREQELEELIRTHPDFEKGNVPPENFMMLERLGFDVSELWKRSSFPVLRGRQTWRTRA